MHPARLRPRPERARARGAPAIRRVLIQSEHEESGRPRRAAHPRSRTPRARADQRQAASVHLPLLSTTTSRSFSLERKETMLPSTHISVTIVSPGNTGDEKRTSKLVMRLASYFASVEITARQAVP